MAHHISIIIPTLNEAAIIPDTLRGLQLLRSAGHEVILADGGSTDGTVVLARPLVDRILVCERGRAQQMNIGAHASHGQILLFLHADTRLPENAATLILTGLAKGHQWGRFDIQLTGRHILLRLVESMMNLRSRLSGIATGDQAIFVERTLFERVGGFPEIALMEDIALSRVLKQYVRPLCVCPPVISSSRRWDERGILRTIFLMWRLRLAYFFGANPQSLERMYRR